MPRMASIGFIKSLIGSLSSPHVERGGKVGLKTVGIVTMSDSRARTIPVCSIRAQLSQHNPMSCRTVFLLRRLRFRFGMSGGTATAPVQINSIFANEVKF